jgi:hypothetical protein
MTLREHGFSSFFPDRDWIKGATPDSVFGYFEPEHIFAVDEVPFNFAEEGKTVAEKGKDAAVRCLRGTGKRFGTVVIMCSGNGDLARFVIIYKLKTEFPKKELEEYKKLKNVIVTHSASSYINENLWIKSVIDKQLHEMLHNR